MKKSILALGILLCGLTSSFSQDNLRLTIEPEQKLIVMGGPREVVLRVDLYAPELKRKKRAPLNIAVVLDRSGSMAGAKIEKARQAAAELVDHLQHGDIFSLVTYSAGVEVLVRAQPLEEKEMLKERIMRIRTDGGTALYAGVQKGAEELERFLSSKHINRVLLLSDGLANIGPSSPAELRRLGNRLSQRGISVTTVGLGDDYNEELMAGLAEASDANYYYVKDTEKLPEIFARELGDLFKVAARDIRIEIICPGNVRPIGFIGRPEKFEGQKGLVKWNNVVAGQSRHMFLRCEVDGTDSTAVSEIATARVRYLDEVDGAEKDLNATVKIGFTRDQREAALSANNEIQGQKNLALNAVAKEKAMALADKGQLGMASQNLINQADYLSSQAPAAPAEVRRKIEAEVDSLKSQALQLREGDYNRGLRKDLQNDSWRNRNSK